MLLTMFYCTGERVDFVCNEMFFKFACGAYHCHEPTMEKTWKSKDFKECTRSTRDLPNFDKEGWDKISPHIMVAGCIMKLTNGSTYDFGKHLVDLCKACSVQPSDVYFFEVNDNEVWATQHNSIKEFSQLVDLHISENREHEFILGQPFKGANKMGKCLQEAFTTVYGKNGEFAYLPVWEQKMRLSDTYEVFRVEPSLECKEEMPSDEEEFPPSQEIHRQPSIIDGVFRRDDEDFSSIIKRCMSDVTNLPVVKRLRGEDAGDGEENR